MSSHESTPPDPTGSAGSTSHSQTVPAYAPPQYDTQQSQQPQQPQHYAPQQPQAPQQATQRTDGPFNVLGLIAVIVLALSTFSSLLQPFIYRQLSMQGAFSLSAYTVVSGIIFFVVDIAAVALAFPGIVTKRQQRGTWLSWVAIGGAGMSILGWVMSLIGNGVAYGMMY